MIVYKNSIKPVGIQTININFLNSGFYIFRIDYVDKTIVKKICVQN